MSLEAKIVSKKSLTVARGVVTVADIWNLIEEHLDAGRTYTRVTFSYPQEASEPLNDADEIAVEFEVEYEEHSSPLLPIKKVKKR